RRRGEVHHPVSVFRGAVLGGHRSGRGAVFCCSFRSTRGGRLFVRALSQDADAPDESAPPEPDASRQVSETRVPLCTPGVTGLPPEAAEPPAGKRSRAAGFGDRSGFCEGAGGHKPGDTRAQHQE
ncbi:unnamed protein product, partial [Ectocarpus sp. 8 AP-2014]